MRGWVAWLVFVVALFGGVQYVIAGSRTQTENQVRPVVTSVEPTCTAVNTAGKHLAAEDYTPAEAHAVFVKAGYDVSAIDCLTGSTLAGAVFTVNDRERGRVLRVEVYPDAVAAQIAEGRVPTGFTTSTWLFNLALFEVEPATKGAVDRHYTELLFSAAHANAPRQ